MIQTRPAPIDDDLERINLRLSELLNIEPADLRLGTVRARRDDFVFCGILGGKDVGKSTLINSLAGREISIDLDEVGEGTPCAIAYVHRDAQPAVAIRVEGLAAIAEMQTVLHGADAIRHVVLIDLPDFDSEFLHHLEQVRTIVPLLDRVIWVVTPRKAGDRDWVALFRRVFKDPTNVWCVLNKLDELLTDEHPFDKIDDPDPGRRFWNDQHEWLADTIERTGLAPAIDRRFIIAAGFCTREAFVRRIDWLWGGGGLRDYPKERPVVERIAGLACEEFERLRAAVLDPVPSEQIAAIKLSNERRERVAACDLLADHYDLDRLARDLPRAFDTDVRTALANEAFDGAFIDGAVARVRAYLDARERLADRVLEQHLEDVPLLSWTWGLLGWLVRRLERPAGRQDPDTVYAKTDGEQTVQGVNLRSRVDGLRTRVAAEFGALWSRLGLDETDLPTTDELTVGLQRRMDALNGHLGGVVLERMRDPDRKTGLAVKLAIWAIALWFSLVQPVAEGVLQAVSTGGLTGWAGGLYHIVAALAPVRLLSGLVVVAAVFVVILTVMASRASAEVRAMLNSDEWRDEATLAVFDAIEQGVLEPLFQPMRYKANQLHQLVTRLQSCRAA